MNEVSRQLGRYELLHRIAKGGMGEIFLAKARGAAGFEKNVIIKTILPHLAEEEEFISKFLDEGRIVVQLLHGNIVPVFDMGEQDGEFFIAMEYVPGRDLREVIKRVDTRRETMPVDLALFIGSEIAKGLDYAHRKTDESGTSMGIIHRDVSPSNVLISSEGEVKLIDFGIARAAGRLSKTVSGRIQGKFCYMSPEQATGRPLDPRSDVFSAGVTIYEMLTGFRPFEGSTDLESLDLVRRCEFDPPSTLNPEVPEEVDLIVQKALSRLPEERYPSAERLQVEILQYLYSTGSSPTSSDVARFIKGLFPEGLERLELKSARNGGAPVPMSLDDALEAELDRMLGGHGDIDPHSTTAMKSGSQPGSLPGGNPTPSTKTGIRPPALVPETHPSQRLKTDETPRHAEPSKRRTVFVLAGIVCTLVALAGWWATRPQTSAVTVESTPTGARLIIDGAELINATTPHTLELKEGVHVIALEKSGFETRTLRVNVVAGQPTVIASTDAKLQAILGPRAFQLSAADGATIFRDQEALGLSPQTLELRPNQVANVRAVKEGCASSNYALSYDHEASAVTLPIDCPVVAVAETETPPVKDRTAKSRNRRVETVEPPIEQGCLDISLVTPAVGDVSIDGGEFKSVSRGARGWPIPPGPHVIRLKNDAAGKDTAFNVDVKPGTPCSLVVWE